MERQKVIPAQYQGYQAGGWVSGELGFHFTLSI
jgi:hypothetical protein